MEKENFKLIVCNKNELFYNFGEQIGIDATEANINELINKYDGKRPEDMKYFRSFNLKNDDIMLLLEDSSRSIYNKLIVAGEHVIYNLYRRIVNDYGSFIIVDKSDYILKLKSKK